MDDLFDNASGNESGNISLGEHIVRGEILRVVFVSQDGDYAVIKLLTLRWLCERAGGYFVKNPEPDTEISDVTLFAATQKILTEFSELLQAISTSTANDGVICTKEAEEIRSEWEDLKSIGENFVRSCEEGHFHFKK